MGLPFIFSLGIFLGSFSALSQDLPPDLPLAEVLPGVRLVWKRSGEWNRDFQGNAWTPETSAHLRVRMRAEGAPEDFPFTFGKGQEVEIASVGFVPGASHLQWYVKTVPYSDPWGDSLVLTFRFDASDGDGEPVSAPQLTLGDWQEAMGGEIVFKTPQRWDQFREFCEKNGRVIPQGEKKLALGQVCAEFSDPLLWRYWDPALHQMFLDWVGDLLY